MFYPSLEEFTKLAKKGNLIPVFKEIMADLETPVSAFLKIKEGKYSYLLESVEQGEKLGRYSFLSSQPSIVFECKDGGISVSRYDSGKSKLNREVINSRGHLNSLEEIMKQYKAVEVKGLPRFYGGAVGYIGYDVVRSIESIPDTNPSQFALSDAYFMLTDNILIFDHIAHTIKIVSCVHLCGDLSKNRIKNIYKEACRKIERIISNLRAPLPHRKQVKKGVKKRLKVRSNFTKYQFEEIVRKAKKYVNRGDIIQVVLSQRFTTDIRCDPFDIYRALRVINPSPYMYYLEMEDFKTIGSSPEILVRKDRDFVEVRPIAGTRRRGTDEGEDKKLAEELITDGKERAEHVMLVDLGRNDLGRVSRYGTVSVPELMVIEKYSHVMHIVSDVIGRIKKGSNSFDLLKACFPAGTVSGAPKVRAMEIIEELENVRRGPYAGAVGYFSFQGNMDMAIAIRTIFVKKKTAFFQAGAGIVSESIPSREYKETLNKARAMLEAIEMAHEGME